LRESVARHPNAGRFSLAREGIEVKTIKVSVSQNPVVVNQGDVDVGECAGISVVTNAYNKGAHGIFIFAAGSVKPAYVIIAGKKFKTLKDLKGGKFASPGPQSTAAEAVELVMRGAGMAPGKDYTFISAGAGAARVAALVAGRVEAISTYSPLNYRLIDDGFNQVADEMDYVPDYVSGTMLANRKWSTANPDVLVRISRVLVKIGDWLLDPASKAEVVDWFAANYHVGRKPIGKAYAEKFYEDIIAKKRFTADGYASKAIYTKNLDIMASRGYLRKESYPDLSKLVDYSYLNKALDTLKKPKVKPF
jgi:ABC-type nitrate/sulfonate/bicarbonate transport system substrate-binding protein